MADKMIFISPDQFLGNSFVHPQMIEDLLGVASVEMENIQQISTDLQVEPGFLTEDRLAEIVAFRVDEDDLALSVANAIQNLRPGVLPQSLETIDVWRQSNPKNTERFSQQAFESLQQKLPVLIQDYKSLNRMRKANRLGKVLGNELERTEFICDARPVYDNDREKIEGLVSTTTMKLFYERQNGSTEELEVRITSDQLDDLITKAQKAQQKLKVLEESISRWIEITE